MGLFSVAISVLRGIFLTDVMKPSIFEWGLVPGKSAAASSEEVLCVFGGWVVSLI